MSTLNIYIRFKLQLVKLYENGKFRADSAREYDVTHSMLACLIKNHKKTGLFAMKDNCTEEGFELV